MISGSVNSDLEAVVSLEVRSRFAHPRHGPSARELRVDAVIDSGFSGYLVLSPESIRALHLPRFASGRIVLANGEDAVVDFHAAEIRWDGRWIEVEICAAGGEALLGMSMLRAHELNIEVTGVGKVTIRSLKA